MEIVTTILLLLACVVASSAIARASASVLPLPLVQIGLGALIAFTFNLDVSLDPQFFLLVFIAPLLFLDGWRIPKPGLLRDKWTIVTLAFGLVLFTVVGAGFFIHWMIPAVPLAVGCALAALLSPTDAVAVSAIATRVPIPKRLMEILEGESLLNDASGLVCFRFAVAAAMTGTFSIVEASSVLVWLTIGGVGVGAAVTMLANVAKDWISKHFGEETGAQILISLLIPFSAYILAERLAASGILAAVAAGIVMSYEEKSGRATGATRIRRAAVWDAIQFAANGVIFVLLGQQLPGILAGAGQAIRQTGQKGEIWLVFYVVAISIALLALRSVWAWATLDAISLRAAAHGEKIPGSKWRLIAVASLAGARGALTLSGVMSLPLTLPDGAPFPTRNLAIVLVAGSILVSLLAAHIGLPYLLKGRSPPSEALRQREASDARLAAAQAAVAAIESTLNRTLEQRGAPGLHLQTGEWILAQYRQRIDVHVATEQSGPMPRVEATERTLRLIALSAERDELYRLAHSGKLTEEVIHMLVREIDLQESSVMGR